jgi:ATP-dependent Clp protease adaptor protein ClpS
MTTTVSPLEATSTSVRQAPLYSVLVHNDDVTPFPFVTGVLGTIFGLGTNDARRVAVEAHESGIALVALLPLEQAEFKVGRAHSVSRSAKLPLKFSYEPESG